MQVYMLPFQGVDASSSPAEVALPYVGSGKLAQIGDLVLGIISVSNPNSQQAFVADVSSAFASEVTENSSIPGAPALVQTAQNLNNRVMIALMQRGNLQT